MHCPGQLLPTVQNSARISSFKQDHHRLFSQFSAVEMVRFELTKQWSSAGRGKAGKCHLNFPFDKLHLHQASTSVVHSANKFMSGLASGFPLLPSFHLLLIASCSVLLPLFTWLPATGRPPSRQTEGVLVSVFAAGGRQLFRNWVTQLPQLLARVLLCTLKPNSLPVHNILPIQSSPPPTQTNKLCSRNIFRRHGAKLRVRTPPPLQGSRTKVAALGVAVFVSLMA